jgi:hypothetical protein
MFVDLVAEQVDIPVADQLGEAIKIRRVDQRAAGIVRRVQHDHAGARRNRISQFLPIDGEIRQAQRLMDTDPAGELHSRLVAVVAGIEDDHFIAGADDRVDRTEDRLGRPRGDGDFGVSADLATIERCDLDRHLLAQRRQACHRRVLVVPGHDMTRHGFAQRIRAIEIRKALGQVQRAGLARQLRHRGENGGADVGKFARDHLVSFKA